MPNSLLDGVGVGQLGLELLFFLLHPSSSAGPSYRFHSTSRFSLKVCVKERIPWMWKKIPVSGRVS